MLSLEPEKILKNTTQIERENSKKAFIDTTIGKVVNAGLNFAIRAFLPKGIEKPVIYLKDTIFSMQGKKETNELSTQILEKANALEKEKLQDVNSIVIQMKNFFQEDKTIQAFSNIIDDVLKDFVKKDKLSMNTSKLMKEGKNIILQNIKENIDHEFKKQINYLETLQSQVKEWKQFYQKQDIEQMKKVATKIEKSIERILPIESLLKEARQIQNVQKLLKQNQNQFNLSDTKLELAKILA